MSLTGLLILSSPTSSQVRKLLSKVTSFVEKTLYVHPCVAKTQLWPIVPHTPTPKFQSRALKTVHAVYNNAYTCCGSLDVRVFLDHLKMQQVRDGEKRTTQFSIDVVLTDADIPSKQLRSFLNHKFVQNFDNVDVVNLLATGNNFQRQNGVDGESLDVVVLKGYENVVLGGTFDRLHGGHKIFLSEAVMRCVKRLTVGVTDENMIAKKLLPELIEPTSFRIETVTKFLTDVDPFISYNVVPISDPFGPSIEDPALECVVVSEETVRGGEKINEQRLKKEFQVLDLCVVKLVEDSQRSEDEEFKISSSSFRMRSLGTHLRPPEVKPHLPKIPYLVGVTGGIASGKSAICDHLRNLGAGIVHSDQLAHKAYQPGTDVHAEIVSYFGNEVLGANGEINRRELGAMVFGNKEKLEKLNSIVWPEVESLMLAAIQQLSVQGKHVIVLEIPLLIEAKMTSLVHEVWISVIPPEEAVERVKRRDNLSTEQAEQRIQSQLSNKQRLAHADVVFCSLWEPAKTKKQVERAWNELQSFLEVQAKSKI